MENELTLSLQVKSDCELRFVSIAFNHWLNHKVFKLSKSTLRFHSHVLEEMLYNFTNLRAEPHCYVVISPKKQSK